MTSNTENNINKRVNFPAFEDVKVSTKTFIAMTNISINLPDLFDFLPVTEYVLIPKRRGRKRKNEKVDMNKNITPGSIVTLKYKDRIRGVDLKQKKNKKRKDKWFRNSFTVVIIMDDKPINFKICQNGMFQITGCKIDEHAENCVKFIWEFIKDQTHLYKFTRNGTNLETLFVPAMRNIDFNMGIIVDREKLAQYMCIQTEFHSLLETSFGYTGVNIKIPVVNDITEMNIKKILYINGVWCEEITTYSTYLELLSQKEREKKLNKVRYNTFLVFHSGCVIFSGLCELFMVDTYYNFANIINKCAHLIEEKLDDITC